MWLITPIGFSSIVQKSADTNSDTLTMRSRVRTAFNGWLNRLLSGCRRST